jgi:deazaflavin-dependent oxidoreductase (nitroreductase family)
MPSKKDALTDYLARNRQITISTTGRKSGRTISVPIWFVFDGGKLFLLPVKGSETQWYQNAVKNPAIHVSTRGAEGDFKAEPITDAKQVSSVVEKFREKYGAGDVKKYYSKFDVAVLAKSA